jgi:acetyltransferase-like isoleucine patch superfamily enzyme
MGELISGHMTYGHTGIIRRGCSNTITIGKYCSIAEGIVMDSGFNHNYNFVSTYPFKTKLGLGTDFHENIKDINIGNDVWIGEGALIFSGVTIGDGAVIGARAIITKDVRPYAVVVGNNREIKCRFDYGQIKELLKIKWWDWSDEKVLENAILLSNCNIQEFINKHKVL